VILLRGAGAGWKSWSQGIRGLEREGVMIQIQTWV
jgi:hypothetical protein